MLSISDLQNKFINRRWLHHLLIFDLIPQKVVLRYNITIGQPVTSSAYLKEAK